MLVIEWNDVMDTHFLLSRSKEGNYQMIGSVS